MQNILRELQVQNPDVDDVIIWRDRQSGTFTIKDQDRLAKLSLTRGRCYDQNLLRFSAKNFRFSSKTNIMIKFGHNLALFRQNERWQFFLQFLLAEIFLKIITSVPE
jgi:hypothetical protein